MGLNKHVGTKNPSLGSKINPYALIFHPQWMWMWYILVSIKSHLPILYHESKCVVNNMIPCLYNESRYINYRNQNLKIPEKTEIQITIYKNTKIQITEIQITKIQNIGTQ